MFFKTITVNNIYYSIIQMYNRKMYNRKFMSEIRKKYRL